MILENLKMLEKMTFNDLRQKEREARKKLIIDAAQKVFAVKPYDKVSMKEIAKEAGISTASIYTYFESQEALFAESFLRDTNILVQTLNKEIDKNEKVHLQRVINSFIDYFNDHDAYYRMMGNFMLNGSIGSESLGKLEAVVREILNSFDLMFKKMGYKDEVRLRSHLFFAFLNGLLISFRKYPGRTEKEEVLHMKRLGKIATSLFQKEIK